MLRLTLMLILNLGLAAGAASYQLTFGSNWDGNPSWSPDGSKIVFERGYESMGVSHYDIAVKNADGSGVAQILVDNPEDDLNPSWSPDGTRIAFHSGRVPQGIWVNNLSTGETDLLIENGHDACWSPDGNQIVYDKKVDNNWDVYKTDLTTMIETRLTSGTIQDGLPDWSHDGQFIIFNRGDLDPEMVIIPANGGTESILPYPGWDPKWSPDGKKICFDQGSITSGIYIYVYNLDTGVLESTHILGQEPDWSPDGKKLVYKGAASHLWVSDYTIYQDSSWGQIKARYR